MHLETFQPRGCNTATNNPPKAQGFVVVTGAGVQTIDLVAQGVLPGPPASETVARFMVDGTSNIAWCYGAGTGLTYANGEAMLANSVECFAIPAGVTVIAVTALAAGSTLRVMPGDGN